MTRCWLANDAPQGRGKRLVICGRYRPDAPQDGVGPDVECDGCAMIPCPHCSAPYEPCRRGAVKDKCARCYQWSRQHPGEPIPPRGAPRVAIVGPGRVSFGCPPVLLEMMDALGIEVGQRSTYIRQALEERLVRETAARAQAAAATADRG